MSILESVADAIDAARYAHPEHPRERPRPFSEADRSDREYAIRLARAAVVAVVAYDDDGLVRDNPASYCRKTCVMPTLRKVPSCG